MKEREYCVECDRDMSEIDNDHLHDKYHMLADRVAFMKLDINKCPFLKYGFRNIYNF